MRTSSIFLIAALAVSACGKDSSTTPGTDTTNGGSTSPSGLNVAVDSGFSDRTAVVGTTIPARVHVTQAGVGSPGVTVTWAVTAGGGSVSTTTTTTDATGAASTQWTIGDTVRVNSLQATITGASATMQVTSLPGPVTTLAKASPDSTAVVAGASLLLAVRATDKSGNVVADVPITWTSTGGTLTVSNGKTGPSGRAETGFTTAQTAATYTVTASAAGLGSATFKVVGF